MHRPQDSGAAATAVNGVVAMGGEVHPVLMMKSRMFCAITALGLCVPMLWAQPLSATVWGAPSGGLQLGVAASVDGRPANIVSFEVSFRNTGANDFVLNLGHMLGNGKVMLPDAVRLVLTRPSGTTCELHYFDRRYPRVAGRVDDFVVALPAEAEYTLRLNGDRLWCAATQEFQTALAPGPYRVTIRFQGRGAETENLDMKGVSLLAFWKGTAESGQASFHVEQ